jgi:hypothetical protein
MTGSIWPSLNPGPVDRSRGRYRLIASGLPGSLMAGNGTPHEKEADASINPLPEGIHSAAMCSALPFVPLSEKRICVFAART